jgi:hypothetical protein
MFAQLRDKHNPLANNQAQLVPVNKVPPQQLGNLKLKENNWSALPNGAFQQGTVKQFNQFQNTWRNTLKQEFDQTIPDDDFIQPNHTVFAYAKGPDDKYNVNSNPYYEKVKDNPKFAYQSQVAVQGPVLQRFADKNNVSEYYLHTPELSRQSFVRLGQTLNEVTQDLAVTNADVNGDIVGTYIEETNVFGQVTKRVFYPAFGDKKGQALVLTPR